MQLNHSALDLTYNSSETFSGGTQPVHNHLFNCSGEEERLWHECSFTTYRECSHADDIGVHCEPGIYTLQTHVMVYHVLHIALCSDGELRLVGGDSELNGIVEICSNQRWKLISRYRWYTSQSYYYQQKNYHNLDVVCRELGLIFPGMCLQNL